VKIILPVLIAVVAPVAFSTTGCHKSGGSAERPKTVEEATSQLRALLPNASPAVQSNFFNGVNYDIHYHNYAAASDQLQQIASDPGLNAQQKQAVADLDDLLKQAMQTPPAQ
jgi:hypothetical protein